RLLARAKRLVDDPGLAEDLVQETFLVVTERAHGFDKNRRCLPYLLGILSWRAWRARGRHGQGEALGKGPLGDDQQPLNRAVARELRAAVTAAIAVMPTPYAEVLAPYLLERATPAEIGNELGRPASTVRVQVHRGLQLLRAALPAGLA